MTTGDGSERQRLTARVEGKVQGVGYRWWVRGRANQMGLTGWVMNDADERGVTVVAEGPAEALDALELLLREGPAAARVDSLAASREPASGEFRSFDITRG